MLKQKQVKFLYHASLADLTSSGLNTPEFSYITGENAFYTKIGGVNTLIGGGKFWGLKGNAGTTPGTDFIGTTDNQNLVFKRNNVQIGLLTTDKIVWGLYSFNPASTTGTGLYQGGGYANFFSNTSGSQNAIGGGANNFFANTTGNYNAVGAGFQNFSSNTSGSYNTALGQDVFYSNTTGSYNIGIGYRPFYSNTTGEHNIGIGFNNLFNSILGSFNIGLGYANGVSIVTGSNNVLVGRNNFSNITDSSNNVGFGNFIDTLTTNTVVNNTPMSNFTVTNVTGGVEISGTDIASAITASGGSVGSYSLIANVPTVNSYPAKIVNSNTIFRPFLTVAQATGKTLTLQIPNNVTNSSGLGSNVIITKSNQVTLGGANTTEVKFRGESGYNYAHDVSSILGSGDDGKVWTYEHSSASIKMKSIPFSSNSWSLTGNNSTNPSTNFIGTTDAQSLVFKTNNAEAARILSNGNFGIGIASPTSKLHVNGSATVDGNLNLTIDSSQIIGGFGANALTGVLDWNDISNARSGNGYTLLSGSDTNGTGLEAAVYYHPFSFEYNTKNGTGNLTQFAVPYKGENTAGKLHYRSRVSGVWTPWQRVVTKAQGDIDYARLAGNNSWTGTNTFFNEFVLRDNSKAGTDPAYIKIITFKDNANAEVGWQGYGSNTNNNYYFYNNQGGFTFYTNGAERLNILNNGNVGIGIAVPTEKLHVAGSVRIVDGTQGLGKVFTSDANGVGTWQTPSSFTVYGSYDDDTDAAANGVPIDGVYEYSSTNTEGMPEGVLKRRKN